MYQATSVSKYPLWLLPCFLSITASLVWGIAFYWDCCQARPRECGGQTGQVLAVWTEETCFSGQTWSQDYFGTRHHGGLHHDSRTISVGGVTLENLWDFGIFFSLDTQDFLRYIQQDLPSHSDGEHLEGDRKLAKVETAISLWSYHEWSKISSPISGPCVLPQKWSVPALCIHWGLWDSLARPMSISLEEGNLFDETFQAVNAYIYK